MCIRHTDITNDEERVSTFIRSYRIVYPQTKYEQILYRKYLVQISIAFFFFNKFGCPNKKNYKFLLKK